jgi:hypothetical protein
MARKPSPSGPVVPLKLVAPRSQIEAKLKAQLQAAEIIKDLPINSDNDLDHAEAEETKWRDYNITLLKQVFNNPSKADEFEEKTRPISIALGSGHYTQEAIFFRRRMSSNITQLESILVSLELIPELIEAIPPLTHLTSLSRKIFIVHGHDDAAKEAVARFIHQMDLSPVILNEQPNEGQTIIEKFEKSSSEVGYAVVLLTPDDVGAPKNKPEELKPRARQNVIFELGYFAAKLGRKNVCALYKGGIEIPSDYHGVVYISMDSADWKMRLAMEIKQVIPIDLNKAYT